MKNIFFQDLLFIISICNLMNQGESANTPNTWKSTASLIDQIYLCPITREIMLEPVVASDGFTYEEDALLDHLKINKASPITREVLDEKYYKNINVKNKIIELLSNNPDLKEAQYTNYKFKNNKSLIMNMLNTNPIDITSLQNYYLFDLTDIEFNTFLKNNITTLPILALQHICNNILKSSTFSYKQNIGSLQKIVLSQGTIEIIDLVFTKLVLSDTTISNLNNVTLRSYNTLSLNKEDFIDNLDLNTIIDFESTDVLEVLNIITSTLYEREFKQLKQEVVNSRNPDNNTGTNIDQQNQNNDNNDFINYLRNILEPYNQLQAFIEILMDQYERFIPPLITALNLIIRNGTNVQTQNNYANKSIPSILFTVFLNIITFICVYFKMSYFLFRLNDNFTQQELAQKLTTNTPLMISCFQKIKNLRDISLKTVLDEKVMNINKQLTTLICLTFLLPLFLSLETSIIISGATIFCCYCMSLLGRALYRLCYFVIILSFIITFGVFLSYIYLKKIVDLTRYLIR